MIVKYEKQQGKKGNHFMLLKKELFISSNFFFRNESQLKISDPKMGKSLTKGKVKNYGSTIRY